MVSFPATLRSSSEDKRFISDNREADIRSLALRKVPKSVNVSWCLRQIEGYQLAKKKLPLWAETEDIWFPPRLSMEQCSSEMTARYKRGIIDRLALSHPIRAFVDLTGGFGVDFCYMAKGIENATYVEQQEVLCAAATHNLPLLGLPNARIENTNSGVFLEGMPPVDAIFLDPARRDTNGQKTYAIEDCTPDVAALQNKLLDKATFVIVKLSPMLDITHTLRTLNNVREVHIVSVKGECKELIFVLSTLHTTDEPTFHCVNLNTTHAPFFCQSDASAAPHILPSGTPVTGYCLYEPNASIQKAGAQNAFAVKYNLQKLHPSSNLFVSPYPITAATTLPYDSSFKQDTMPKGHDIPARAFHIVAISDFSKASLKAMLKGISQGNITIRNFPSTVSDLRTRLKLKDGGEDYLFATTISDGTHILIRCRKIHHQ